ncbi:large ribosomal subunit protein bL12m [Anolis carolinensis]|uniref:Large ribosomal subunit protein bL12m n=1 Tax=Anolis carolinensis TaxID=28377 RepID=G1KKH4_ANOCA|nr:PREDICTED: 39S ribosomal protein L12, mitochondrial isoform X1 [Anolis carolinensis]|eukprot:XP_008102808.1 PREDICTED: 39S ribosomal protein L12, mitochondrial isoform X1 [Anolis carolinensis]
MSRAERSVRALCRWSKRQPVPPSFLPPLGAAAMAMLPAGRLGAALRLLLRQHQPRVCPFRMLKGTCTQQSEALASPPLDNAPKEYSPKIQQLVQDIANLTLLEISDLNQLLKKTLKIEDMGLMSMAGMMPSAQPVAPVLEEEDVPKKQEKLNFTVKLTDLKAAEKVKLIKEVKNCMQGLNLVQAKKLVESLPQEIKANIPKEEAEKIKAALEAAGGTVVLE